MYKVKSQKDNKISEDVDFEREWEKLTRELEREGIIKKKLGEKYEKRNASTKRFQQGSTSGHP